MSSDDANQVWQHGGMKVYTLPAVFRSWTLAVLAMAMATALAGTSATAAETVR